MKNLMFLFLSLLFFSTIISCEKELGIQIKSDPTPPSIIKPTEGQACSFTADMGTNPFNIKWQHADYGFAAFYSYTIQIDKQGNGFAKPAKLGTSETDSLVYTVEKFNTAVKKLKYKTGDEVNIEIRVISTVSPALDDLISSVNTIKYKVY